MTATLLIGGLVCFCIGLVLMLAQASTPIPSPKSGFIALVLTLGGLASVIWGLVRLVGGLFS
jgi:hypothetical protein